MSEGKVRPVSRPGSRPVADESEKGKVRVVYGVHALETHVAGRTVGSVREALRQALNISPRAVAVVDGVEVDEERVLHEGELLEFVRLAGEKGMDRRGRRHGEAGESGGEAPARPADHRAPQEGLPGREARPGLL